VRTTARIPLGRLATPDDIAPAITFLAGPGGGYVNGAFLVIDGGLTVS
jgi:3-oxoacyl-[acyl-carrier protein] reductase